VVFFADRALPFALLAVTHKSTRALFVLALCALSMLLARPTAAFAQGDVGGCDASKSQHLVLTQVTDNHRRLSGSLEQPVQIDCDEMQLFADTVEHFQKETRLVAQGHVLFVSGTVRVSAERVDFNTRTRTGTFYMASGTALMKAATPGETAGEQEPYAFFWGDELRKIGPTKYKIIDGGFTACVQPTPRWETKAGSFEVNLNDYVLLKNAIFKVKGVPVLYLPLFYYPMEEDDRSTGFLMPSYGTATLAGQRLTNAFFWAINRSQDATFTHDWFTKTGQGYGGQYRYVLGGGSSGNARVYRLNEKATTVTTNGVEQTRAGQNSFNLNGDLVQTLGAGLRARGYVDYFSRLETQQKLQQNVYHATNRTRRYGGNLSGSWAEYVLNATLEQRDIFDGSERLTRDGNLPRVSLSRGQRPIGKSPLNFAVTGEYATFKRKTIVSDETVSDQGVTRMDVNPVLQIPFTKWPFLQFTSVVAWRGTFWSESLDVNQVQVPDAIGRSFFDFQGRVTGPTFNRIWDNGSGRRVKHVIEPSLAIQRTTAIDDFERYVKLEGTDYIIGSTTRYTYGITNRLYAKRENSREVLNVAVMQTYYTDARAAQYDRNNQSFNTAPTNFGPISITGRTAPTAGMQGSFRTEWDHQANAIRTIAASGTFNHGPWLQSEAGWSLRRALEGIKGFEEASATHYLNASTTLRTARNNFGGTYSFNYDMRNDDFLQQRYMAYYNAQCCGVAVEWQTWNLQGTAAGVAVPQDRRFNISVTLAGIGAVPNFFGGLSGNQNRR
jgi:LPS-assembly protein